MNKFAKQLSKTAKSLGEDRATRWANGAMRAQRTIMDRLQTKKDNVEEQLENHNDLSTLVHNSNPGRGKGEFEAEAHMEKIQELEVRLLEVNVEMKAAQGTWDKWFKEEEKD